MAVVADAHDGPIWALAVVDEYKGEPLIVTGGAGVLLGFPPGARSRDEALLEVTDAHDGEINAVAVVNDYEGAPLIVSAGDDRVLRGFRLGAHNRRDAILELRHGRTPTALGATSRAHLVVGFSDGALMSFDLQPPPPEAT